MEQIAEFASLHHGVFPLHEARAVGITRNQLFGACDNGDIVRLYERVYRFRAAPITWKTQLVAACWAGGTRSVGSHRSAAALRELTRDFVGFVEVTCPRWRRAQHAGLIVHESKALDAVDISEVDGIPCTTVARTLLDLGAVCTPFEVERALENALRRKLVTLGELDAMIARLSRPGRGGLRTLRRLVHARMTTSFRPTDSEGETRFLQAIRRHHLPEPIRQFTIHDGFGVIGRVDFCYPDARIAIEYDSDAFHTGRVATAEDAARRHRLVRAGWLPLVAGVGDLRDGGALFCAALAASLRDRGTHRALASAERSVPALLTPKRDGQGLGTGGRGAERRSAMRSTSASRSAGG